VPALLSRLPLLCWGLYEWTCAVGEHVVGVLTRFLLTLRRYVAFLSMLGNLVLLKDLSPVYSGGLDCTSNKHGEYMCQWQGDVTHVAFHTATLIPTLPDDDQCVNKRMHIDNRHVTIVYNDSGTGFQREWLSDGAVNFAYIIVTPMGDGLFRVSVDIREGMDSVLSIMDDRVVSEDTVGVFCRQLAIHANMASLSHRKQTGNWEQRLKLLRSVADKHGVASPTEGDPTIDFTHFL
jgi:tuberous sclerosis protein 2